MVVLPTFAALALGSHIPCTSSAFAELSLGPSATADGIESFKDTNSKTSAEEVLSHLAYPEFKFLTADEDTIYDGPDLKESELGHEWFLYSKETGAGRKIILEDPETDYFVKFRASKEVPYKNHPNFKLFKPQVYVDSFNRLINNFLRKKGIWVSKLLGKGKSKLAFLATKSSGEKCVIKLCRATKVTVVEEHVYRQTIRNGVTNFLAETEFHNLPGGAFHLQVMELCHQSFAEYTNIPGNFDSFKTEMKRLAELATKADVIITDLHGDNIMRSSSGVWKVSDFEFCLNGEKSKKLDLTLHMKDGKIRKLPRSELQKLNMKLALQMVVERISHAHYKSLNGFGEWQESWRQKYSDWRQEFLDAGVYLRAADSELNEYTENLPKHFWTANDRMNLEMQRKVSEKNSRTK